MSFSESRHHEIRQEPTNKYLNYKNPEALKVQKLITSIFFLVYFLLSPFPVSISWHSIIEEHSTKGYIQCWPNCDTLILSLFEESFRI